MELTALLSILLLSSTLVHASLNLSNIQELVGFPEACTAAYDTPIPDCNSAHFVTGPLCSCTSACESALNALTTTIIAACQGTAASADTLIGLFFDNQATSFLCTPPADLNGDGGCATATEGSGSMSSAPSSTQASAPSSSTPSSSATVATTTTSNSQTTSSTTTTQTSSSTLSMKSTASTASMTSSKTSASSSKSIAMSKMSSTTSTSSMSSSTIAASSSQPKQTSGGGSPFDTSSNAGTRVGIRTHMPALFSLFLATIVTSFS